MVHSASEIGVKGEYILMKFTVFVEEQLYGTSRPVEIVANAPVALIVPALVEELQLPKRDKAGEVLHYVLRLTPGSEALSDGVTLQGAGIVEGMTLLLEVTNPRYIQPQQYDFTSSGPLTLTTRYHDNSLHSSATFSDDSAFSSVQNSHAPAQRRGKRAMTRRAFVTTGLVALGIGTVGAAYAGYRSLHGSIHALTAMSMQSATSVQKTPVKAMTPTMARRGITFSGHKQTARVVRWSPQGTMLMSGADDAQVLLWRANGTVERSILHPAAVHAVAWSPDGGRIVTGSNVQVLFLDVKTNTVLNRSVHRHIGAVSGLAWTSHNQHAQVVSVGIDMQAFVWNTVNYRTQLDYKRHTAPIDAVTWAMDGQSIATSSHGGAVRVWNAKSGQDVHDLYYVPNVPLRSLSFSPNGSTLAVSADDGLVRLWNGLTCQQAVATNAGPVCSDVPQQLRVSRLPVRTLAWSPNGRFLATGSDDGVLTLWQPSQSQQPLLRVTVQQNVPIYSLSWSPKGDQLATTTGNNVVLWHII